MGLETKHDFRDNTDTATAMAITSARRDVLRRRITGWLDSGFKV